MQKRPAANRCILFCYNCVVAVDFVTSLLVFGDTQWCRGCHVTYLPGRMPLKYSPRLSLELCSILLISCALKQQDYQQMAKPCSQAISFPKQGYRREGLVSQQ